MPRKVSDIFNNLQVLNSILIIILKLYTERIKFFQSMRKTLEEAAVSGFCELYLACVAVMKSIQNSGFKVPFLESKECLLHLPQDSISKKLLPSDWKHATPIQCYGDGNCLYR